MQQISQSQDLPYLGIILMAEAITWIDSEMLAKTSGYVFFFINSVFFLFHSDASPSVTWSFCQRKIDDVS